MLFECGTSPAATIAATDAEPSLVCPRHHKKLPDIGNTIVAFALSLGSGLLLVR